MYLSCVGIDVVGGRSSESIRPVALPDAFSNDGFSLRPSWYPSAVGHTASKRAVRNDSRDGIVVMTSVIVEAPQSQGRNAVLTPASVTAVSGIPYHPLFRSTHFPLPTHHSVFSAFRIHLILKLYTAPASSSQLHPSSQAQTQSPTPRPPRLSPPSRSAPR
ncbi:hypothetical protein COCC4DRAFT_131812 [Bipolaris maydis ATCC 48331]|uniref:Uncharacterized protein n=2 Tax=Cochliobolus heterostrophus TaxID=5016 RepID=M2UK04_COCH5|nr:uncharacterized protein COCC4DRAFT_131812 [Bipolaris maydis ATCC 48331]EMD93981.1 hypothetical protein COCHEDRAFT_1094432 [Bipolaris maydis C5]ENI07717.1 hypothetical protein COCC4DRAFT_131812 [Bipolaris maydis ATCC 48331]